VDRFAGDEPRALTVWSGIADEQDRNRVPRFLVAGIASDLTMPSKLDW